MKGWEQECRWGENPEILSVTFSPQPVKTGEWSLFQLVLFNTISLPHAVQIGSCSQVYRRVAWPDLKGASRYLAGNRSGTDPTARAKPWMDQQPRGHLHLFPYSSLMPLLSGAAPQCFLTGISFEWHCASSPPLLFKTFATCMMSPPRKQLSTCERGLSAPECHWGCIATI